MFYIYSFKAAALGPQIFFVCKESSGDLWQRRLLMLSAVFTPTMPALHWEPRAGCWKSTCLHSSGSRDSWCLCLTVLLKSDTWWPISTAQLQSSKLSSFFSEISIVPQLFGSRWSSRCRHLCPLFYSCPCKWLHYSVWVVTAQSAQALECHNFWFFGSTICDQSSSRLHFSRGVYLVTSSIFGLSFL